ncbi:MAG: hypothetical protein K2M45_06685 [Muribaculaceae bacterium]|nr:hypothetical protein [Muribaculaceae bacterium]
MDEYILVYLYDVKKAIDELESYFIGYPMRYEVFEKDYLRRSTVERKTEIMAKQSTVSLKSKKTFLFRMQKQ